MLMIPVLTAVCSAGVVFYLRFLVALCRECKPRLTGYWVRLRLHSDEEGVIAMKPIEKPVTRAA